MRCPDRRPPSPPRTRSIPTKNLGGIGDGGAVVVDDAALAGRVTTLRAHGMTAQYVHESVSQNFRMSELEAAWLRLGLESLDDDRRPPATDRGDLSSSGATPALAARRPASRLPLVCVPHDRPRVGPPPARRRRRGDRRPLSAGTHATARLQELFGSPARRPSDGRRSASPCRASRRLTDGRDRPSGISACRPCR